MDETEMMKRQMNPMAASPMGVDMTAMFKQEKTALTAVSWERGVTDICDAVAVRRGRGCERSRGPCRL